MSRLVVFVCAHGAAKSVVAATWLNHLADRAGLPVHAVARGIQPDAHISDSALSGLRGDGLGPSEGHPRAAVPVELASAWRVINVGAEPDELSSPASEHWDIPAVSDGYPEARDRLLVHLHELLRQI